MSSTTAAEPTALTAKSNKDPSNSSSSSTTSATSGDAATASQPIRVLPNPQAAAASQAHPALLLALLALRFRALVADPVPALSSALPAVAAVQMGYAVLCLPAAGSSPARYSRKLRPGEKRKSDGAEPNVAVTIVVALVISAAAALALHALLVLFGAPLFAYIPHTLLCSAHLSLLAFFPLLYTRGVSGESWLEILGARAPLDEVFGGLAGAAAGAWLGAVPIPLDWDREWQKWPVTIVAGIYAGYALGKLVGGTVAFGKRLG